MSDITSSPENTTVAGAIGKTLTLPCGAVLKNRIAKSALSEALGDEHNNPTDGLINLFGRWSRGGAALVITGNTPVDRWHLEHLPILYWMPTVIKSV